MYKVQAKEQCDLERDTRALATIPHRIRVYYHLGQHFSSARSLLLELRHSNRISSISIRYFHLHTAPQDPPQVRRLAQPRKRVNMADTEDCTLLPSRLPLSPSNRSQGRRTPTRRSKSHSTSPPRTAPRPTRRSVRASPTPSSATRSRSLATRTSLSTCGSALMTCGPS